MPIKEIIARIDEDFLSSPVDGCCVLSIDDWQIIKDMILPQYAQLALKGEVEMKNIIYNAVSKITDEREANGSYKGNAHHLAQEITDAVFAAITENNESLVKFRNDINAILESRSQKIMKEGIEKPKK